MLAARPAAAGVVADAFDDISRPAVSRHLRVLREAGLVVAESHGRHQIYTVDTVRLDELTGWVEALVRASRFLDHLDALGTEVYRTRRERPASEPVARSDDTNEEQTA